ncbi:MAG TPA: hypothetical protein VF243_06275, partial [Nitrosospira sp.]
DEKKIGNQGPDLGGLRGGSIHESGSSGSVSPAPLILCRVGKASGRQVFSNRPHPFCTIDNIGDGRETRAAAG